MSISGLIKSRSWYYDQQREYILIIKISGWFSFVSRNVHVPSVFFSLSYSNTHESLGEHEKAMETCLQLELPWHAGLWEGRGGGVYSPNFLQGLWDSTLETCTLFQTEIFDFLFSNMYKLIEGLLVVRWTPVITALTGTLKEGKEDIQLWFMTVHWLAR